MTDVSREVRSSPAAGVWPVRAPACDRAAQDRLRPGDPHQRRGFGLIYTCEAQPLPARGHRVEIKMSMTAPDCVMVDVLREDPIARVQEVPGVAEVDLELVWKPPWDPSRISEAARLELDML